jgi:hypothetical protein
MRGMRVKKLRAIFNEWCKREMYPMSKGGFRLFKKLYNRGTLEQVFPSM